MARVRGKSKGTFVTLVVHPWAPHRAAPSHPHAPALPSTLPPSCRLKRIKVPLPPVDEKKKVRGLGLGRVA